MSCQANRLLAERDSEIPGLGTVLNPEALTALLPADGGHPTGKCRISYIRYKPRTACIVGYTFEDGQWMHATARNWKDWRVKRAAYARQMERAGRPLTSIESHAICVSPFPVDRGLPSLWRWLDSRQNAKLFAKVVPSREHDCVWALKTLAYKYERRYAGQLTANGQPYAVLKFYRDGAYLNLRRALRTLDSKIVLAIPGQLGRSRRHQVVALPWQEGQCLQSLIASSAPVEDGVHRTAVALAELHASPTGDLHLERTDELASQLTSLGGYLAWLAPDLGTQAAELARRLASRLMALTPVRTAIHGDFYTNQAIIQCNRVALIDLDNAAIGDPARDLGNCLAHLELELLYGHQDPVRIGQFREIFLESYRQIAGTSSSVDRCSLMEAIGLFRLATDPFRYAQTDWPTLIGLILDRVERLLDRPAFRSPSTAAHSRKRQTAKTIRPAKELDGQRPDRSAVEGSIAELTGLTGDATFAFLRPSLDQSSAGPRLRSCLPTLLAETDSCQLDQIRVLRHKPKRRCLIEYHFSLHDQPLQILGKARVKGLDTRSFKLQQQLYHLGFDRHSDDGISVPPPLAVIPDWRMWLQAKVPGTVLTEQLTDATESVAEQVATALFKLHRTPILTDRRHTMAAEYQILERRLRRVATNCPEWNAPIVQLLSGCRQLAMSVADDQAASLHRDFYPDQVIIDGRRLFLLDLDLHCRGPAAIDVGNFVGHTIEWSLRTTGRPDGLADLERAFVEHYLRLSGRPLRQAIDACTTLTLSRHISISQLIPERRHITETLIELCRQRVERRNSGRIGCV